MKKLINFKMPRKGDRLIHFSVLILLLLGTLMIISTSVGETYASDIVVYKTIIKQLVFGLSAYFIMVQFANKFTMKGAVRKAHSIGHILVILLFACLLFKSVGGAQCWIRFTIPFVGEMTIQPSEFMKVFMIVIMAAVIERSKNKNWECWDIIKIPFIFYGLTVIAIFLQNDLGSLIVISLICALCLLLPTHPNLAKFQKFVLWVLIMGSLLVVFLASNWGIAILESMDFIPSYMIARFKTAANPWFDPIGSGYQLIQSLYAFASGGLQGLGFGQSIQKLMYLPEAETDYILAITVEELGIIGFGLIFLGYLTIISRLIIYALHSKKESYKIVYIGTALYLFIHFVFNVGGVCGFIPLTGVPLLFISSGSSSLWSICIAIGICQAILSEENRERVKEG